MKHILICLSFGLTFIHSRGQSVALSYLGYYSDSTIGIMNTSFQEIKKVCESDYAKLWGRNLYGPILLVEPWTRHVFANIPDKKGLLIKYQSIYGGILPPQILPANTATEWAGIKWTMVILPLPFQKDSRITLLSHELFHRIQDDLGLPANSPNCNHLDTQVGRLYFRLELAALKAALRKPLGKRSEDLTNALLFRKYRYKLVSDTAAEENERELEFNEGLAEFTGVYVSNISLNNLHYLETIIDSSVNYPTFTRSFAYLTGPIYGMLLSQKQKDWQRKITLRDNFPDLVAKIYGLSVHLDPGAGMVKRASFYDYDRISKEEQKREDNRLAIENKYMDKLVKGPILEIPLVNMNFYFNPTNLFSLGKYGTVYPTLTLNDDWGNVVVMDGAALLSNTWKTLYIEMSPSMDTAGNLIKGAGWELKLKDGWKIVPGAREGDFKLAK